ncbi:MAG: FtsW/RodA/SpoVE family cell cycle protein [Planctomycetota bacterium]|nr:FtsW/RodA/SpoVE family cell cycle protein [Planctomycetota bacterium]MDA1250847.1 FtsW/RodA/SpoVE family cell cycle protein [Planctomycetota bacterium]
MGESPWYHRFPAVIVLTALALIVLGLSAIARGDELYNLGEFAPRQRLWAALGSIVFVIAAVWPYQRLRWISYPIYGGCLLLLVLVFFMPAKNYSHRWIPLGLMDFQPSELAKLAFIAALARYLMHRESFRTWKGLAIPFFMALVPIVLILKEPDLGTSLLFLPVLFAMLFAAGARPRHLATIALLGVLASPFLWMQMSAEQKSRIVSVFTQKTGGEAPRGDGYHLHQSKRVLALGGVFGSEITGMPFKSQRAYHLPESRTDFVFCLVGERWGLIGSLTVLLLYCVLFARGLLIAADTRDPYGRLLAVGIVALIGSQVLINTAMTVGLLPITGMTLPLMSYGGSSLLTMCLALGLLVNIAMRPTTDAVSEPFQFAG